MVGSPCSGLTTKAVPQLSPGVRTYAQEAHRPATAVGLEGRVRLAGTSPEDWLAELTAWSTVGATHISAGTGGQDLSPDQHIDAMRRLKDVAP